MAFLVLTWFERPGTAPGFPPNPATLVRARAVLDETDPYGAAPTVGGPQYKEGVDRDADGADDLFRGPYRGSTLDTFLGAEDAPDLRLEDRKALDSLSQTIFGQPPVVAGGLRVRIRRIDVYAPPYLRVGEQWVRQGTATIKVVAGVERVGVTDGLVSRRTARLVLSEVDYMPSKLEAVHACGDAQIVGPAGVRWGALVATGGVSMSAGPAVPESLPRAVPGPDGADALWTTDPEWLAEFNAKLDPQESLDDPWVRIIAAGPIEGAPSASEQPWAGPPPPDPGTPGPWPCCDRSNLIQAQDSVTCPDYDYAYWKRVARSGFKGAHYYTWHAEEGFREHGTPPGKSIEQIFAESGATPALRFFDTADALAPRDDDGDGRFDNLTPPPTALRGLGRARLPVSQRRAPGALGSGRHAAGELPCAG